MPAFEWEKPVLELEARITELKQFVHSKEMDFSAEIRSLERKASQLRKEIYANLTPFQRVTMARHPKRPTTLDYIGLLFDDFTEFHGDRSFRDDQAIVGGIALFEGQPVTVIGPQKGRDTKENIARNFGLPHPEGYRKALRLMKQAEKFGRPIITLIDVVGAYPGIEAEERGQGMAIAQCIEEMSFLKTPILSIITGEGGSGGALAIGVGDRILMLENAWYSVISPEMCATILWRDSSRAAEAAELLRLTPTDLLKFGIIDDVITEPLGGAHRDHRTTGMQIRSFIRRYLAEIINRPADALVEERLARFRRIGKFNEKVLAGLEN
ncbi:MAG: acetyl-CoA carboxylase carboxyltransferase subunit alpha [Bacillota bacterium]|jgi:acetyl-CoA carboxylase carboxyl transferase subunit alpha|nr:acetyl-CoA carboxylase carboxyltransferase subunit alpha [Bacillota bacterium]NLJ03014.1 acetyl-CoA carboxylase carboxyltransferase subunit alpha [Bacillota bacterium]